MPDTDEAVKEIIEPDPEDMGYCSVCDVEISIPDAPNHLCAHCRNDEVAS
jgi:hypothetical protein